MKAKRIYRALFVSTVLNSSIFAAVGDEGARSERIDLLRNMETEINIKIPDLQVVVESLSDQSDLVRGQAASVVEALVRQKKIDEITARKMYNALFRALTDLKDNSPRDFESKEYDDFIWARSTELLAAMKLGLNYPVASMIEFDELLLNDKAAGFIAGVCSNREYLSDRNHHLLLMLIYNERSAASCQWWLDEFVSSMIRESNSGYDLYRIYDSLELLCRNHFLLSEYKAMYPALVKALKPKLHDLMKIVKDWDAKGKKDGIEDALIKGQMLLMLGKIEKEM